MNFSFDGIEDGLDPDGNRFDAEEIKSEEMLLAAAQDAGLSLSAEALKAVQSNTTVEGSVPENIIREITTQSSVFDGDAISVLSEQRQDAYYPTQYRVTLDYTAAGLTADQGNRLLDSLLRLYQTGFAGRYGYNAAIEQDLEKYDDTQFDYEESVKLLDAGLELLGGYTKQLADRDKGMYRSAETGYSFEDLQAAINTVRSQDISLLTSYLASNNVTNSWKEKADYYNYMIEDQQRARLALQERIDQLSSLIDSYAKTNAVVMGSGTASANEEGVSAAYQITQQSDMYDSLIRQRIELQTEVSEIDSQIQLYRKRVTELRTNSGSEEIAYVEEQLSAIRQKMSALQADVKKLANEYYENMGLDGAFQVLKRSEGTGLMPIEVIKASLGDGVAVEAVIFGIFLLIAALRANGRKKQKLA